MFCSLENSKVYLEKRPALGGNPVVSGIHPVVLGRLCWPGLNSGELCPTCLSSQSLTEFPFGAQTASSCPSFPKVLEL